MSLYNAAVPNLELLIYKAQQLLAHDEEFLRSLKEIKEQGNLKHLSVDFDVIVFSQVWEIPVQDLILPRMEAQLWAAVL